MGCPVAKFAHHRNDSNWETLAQCRKIARICAYVFTGERFGGFTGIRLQSPCYLSRVDHDREMRSRSKGEILENIPF
jgi:hypothetical protein